MNTQTTYPDYRGIVNELIKGFTSESHPHATLFNKDRVSRLKEFRTLRIGGGRQSGKTRAAMEILTEDPNNSILFMKDHGLIQTHFRKWVESGGAEGKSPEYVQEVSRRMICQRSMVKGYDPQAKFWQSEEMQKAPKWILIDEAANHIHFYVKALYEWIAATADPDPIIVLMD